jgi:transcriptional regulator with XRE-family HTH domain
VSRGFPGLLLSVFGERFGQRRVIHNALNYARNVFVTPIPIATLGQLKGGSLGISITQLLKGGPKVRKFLHLTLCIRYFAAGFASIHGHRGKIKRHFSSLAEKCRLSIIGGMGMDAIGAYLAALRDGRGLTQHAFAEDLGVSERSLREWEKGRTAPDVNTLSDLLAKLKGSWMHVFMLTKEGATIDQAKGLARRQVQDNLTDDMRTFIENLDPDQLAALIAVAEQMRRK